MPPPAVERVWESIALAMVALRDEDAAAAFSAAELDASVMSLRFRLGETSEITLGGHYLGRSVRSIESFVHDGDSLLHVSARRGFGEVCNIFIQHGAFLRAKNEIGEQPMEVATGKAKELMNRIMEVKRPMPVAQATARPASSSSQSSSNSTFSRFMNHISCVSPTPSVVHRRRDDEDEPTSPGNHRKRLAEANKRLELLEKELLRAKSLKKVMEKPASKKQLAAAPPLTAEDKETAKKVAALEANIRFLREQLRETKQRADMGGGGGEVEGGKAMTLEELEEALKSAMRAFLAGDYEAENVIEKLSSQIETHPEAVERRRLELYEWEKAQDPLNAAALRTMRTFVPANVRASNSHSIEAAMLAKLDDPKAAAKLAKRVWSNPTLWVTRTAESRFAKTHIADLNNKYHFNRLDIVELRAVYAALPLSFENDADGAKDAWRGKVFQKLREMVLKHEEGKLTVSEVRHQAYRDLPESTEIFDPDEVYEEPEEERRSSFASSGPLESRRSSVANSEEEEYTPVSVSSLRSSVFGERVKTRPHVPRDPSRRSSGAAKLASRPSLTSLDDPQSGGLLAALQGDAKFKQRASKPEAVTDNNSFLAQIQARKAKQQEALIVETPPRAKEASPRAKSDASSPPKSTPTTPQNSKRSLLSTAKSLLAWSGGSSEKSPEEEKKTRSPFSSPFSSRKKLESRSSSGKKTSPSTEAPAMLPLHTSPARWTTPPSNPTAHLAAPFDDADLELEEEEEGNSVPTPKLQESPDIYAISDIYDDDTPGGSKKRPTTPLGSIDLYAISYDDSPDQASGVSRRKLTPLERKEQDEQLRVTPNSPDPYADSYDNSDLPELLSLSI